MTKERDGGRLNQDSLRPHSLDSGLPTLPPKMRKEPRLLMFYGVFIVCVSSLLAGTAIFGMYISPTLGGNSFPITLAVVLLVASVCSLLVLHLIVIDIVRDRRKLR